MEKIITLEKFLEIKKKLKSKKIIMAHGVFDLLHIGHLRYFQQCKKFGQILIVSVTADKFVNKGLNKPFFSETLRMEAVASNINVDFVVISEALTAEKNIQKIKPNFYAKGYDYYKSQKSDLKLKKEIAVLTKNGGKFLILKDIQYSSSKLINSNFFELKHQVRISYHQG